MTTYCHETNAGADMGNKVDNHGISYEIWQGGFDHDDNEHEQMRKNRKRRVRSS
jgi:hypothetical protein